jgi:hypothetical protein
MFDADAATEQLRSGKTTVMVDGQLVTMRMTNSPTIDLRAAIPISQDDISELLLQGVVRLGPHQELPPHDVILTYQFRNVVKEIFVTVGVLGPAVYAELQPRSVNCSLALSDNPGKTTADFGCKFGAFSTAFAPRLKPTSEAIFVFVLLCLFGSQYLPYSCQ